jgi:hypothetical protein
MEMGLGVYIFSNSHPVYAYELFMSDTGHGGRGTRNTNRVSTLT